MEVISGAKITKALDSKTYQMPFPKVVQCAKCFRTANPILIVDDEDGELRENPPKRINGKPIWPHDSCTFVLYMCEDCGTVTVEWNQG